MYLKTTYRNHYEEDDSKCADHCKVFALSDAGDIQKVCSHSHNVKLRNSGIKKAFLRSDEAGCYHNSKLVLSLRGLGYQDCHFQQLTQL